MYGVSGRSIDNNMFELKAVKKKKKKTAMEQNFKLSKLRRTTNLTTGW